MAIAVVRDLPDGATATIDGVLTTDLGALESGRTAFVEDASGGIALYLDAAVITSLPTGTRIVVQGMVDERFAQRTLRVAEGAIETIGSSSLDPAPIVSTGAALESWEGRRIAVSGAVIGGSDTLADGTAIWIDDGTGQVRVVVTPDALAGRSLGADTLVSAAGPLGQRDSSGTGASGYRLYVTSGTDLTVAPTPTPTPTPTPVATETPSPTASPTPTGTPSPSDTPAPTATPTPGPILTPSPSPSPSGSSILAARSQAIGATVAVHGVVTAESGRLGTPSLLAIGDTTSGIVIKLPEGTPSIARGRIVDVAGPLADPYGQLEVRPPTGGIVIGGTAELPAPYELTAGGPSESTEGRLVRLSGLVVARPTKATSGDISLTLEMSDGTQIRVMADASSGVQTTSFQLHARYRVTGIAGQRASKKGMPDGYRIWVRDTADIELLAPPPPGSTASPGPTSTGKPKSTPTSPAMPSPLSIAAALRVTDRDVAIEAVVTAPATLLDTSGRRIVVQDGTGAVEILLPKEARAPAVGAKVRATGRMGTAYGAPRLRASTIETRGTGTMPAALRLTGRLTASHAWKLVSISGRVDNVHKLGDRWRGEIVIGSQRLVVIGQPGARIPSTALAPGRTAEITGIVRLAYPSASDRRPAVLPRSPADIRLGAGGVTSGATTSGAGGATSAGATSTQGEGSTAFAAALAAAPDADLADLATLVGRSVRVGGIVIDLRSTGFTLDDGTDQGIVDLTGEAAATLPLVEPGDAINVIGRVDRVDGELRVVVSDPAAITLGSAIDGLAASIAPDPSAQEPGDQPAAVRTAGLTAGPVGLPGAGFGLAGLGGICLASAAVTALRRRQARRLLAGRVALRLARLSRSGPPPADADGP